ncbi:hypothetical protein DFO80_10631 [Rhodobacter sp. 140A]|nr:hypothetical protein DFO80_10631 [Rhodobacter sp. 140A]
MRKVGIAWLVLMLTAGAVSAADLAERAAAVFADACLCPTALALKDGSDFGEGAGAAAMADTAFSRAVSRGLTDGFVGRSSYTIPADKKAGTYKCYVTSKDLTQADVEKFFGWLVKSSSTGARPTKTGPAKWEDGMGPSPISGKRAEFVSPGRSLVLEAFHFISEKGPVGSIFVTITHRVPRP